MLNIRTIVVSVCAMFFIKLNGQIVTDRPDQTESSATIPKGALQLESGVLLEFVSDDQKSYSNILLPTSLFRYGMSDWIEFRVLNQFEVFSSDDIDYSGISDIEIGAKIQLIKSNDQNIEVAFISHLIIPTGSQDVTSDSYGISNTFSVSHSISENIGLGYNLGYNYFGEGKGDFRYTLALGIGVNDRVGIYVEPYGEISNFDHFILNFDSGFTYLINKSTQFDFSFGTGVNHNMNYISVGCSWLFDRE